MFEEASTGTSGALGRQVTVGPNTTGADWALLDDLEAADARGVVNLYGDGVRDGTPVSVSYKADLALYQVASDQLDRATLESEVSGGLLAATLTAQLPANAGKAPHSQPLLATQGVSGPTGSPDLPVLPGDNPMTLVGIAVEEGASILVDGQLVSGTLACTGGFSSPLCDSEEVVITLDSVPPSGIHLLQIQNPDGLLSNELPLCVGSVGGCL
jgi:hypothetical protein